MPGPFIVQVGQRPSPFQPSEPLQAFVGDSHVVQHAALALAFSDRAEAEAAAARFDLAEVVDTRGLMVQRLDTLTIMASATPTDLMAHMSASPAVRQQNQAKWIRAVCTPDDRCPKGQTPGRAAVWRLREEAR